MPAFHAPQLIPGLYAADVLTRSRGTIKTYFVRLHFDGGAPPHEFISALNAAGFAHNPKPLAEPIEPGVICVVDFGLAGTGPRAAWTEGEEAEFLARLQAAFYAHGVPFDPRTSTNRDLP